MNSTLHDNLAVETIINAIGQDWTTPAQIAKATHYAPGTLRTFLPQLVANDRVLVKKLKPSSGRGRPSLLYKRLVRSEAYVLRLDIPLQDATLSRVLRVNAEKTSIRQLGLLINAAYGWESTCEYHLAEFRAPENMWVPLDNAFPSPDMDNGDHDWKLASQHGETATLLRSPGDEALYLYDFGDQVRVFVTLDDIVEVDGKEPLLLSGDKEGPESDTGSPFTHKLNEYKKRFNLQQGNERVAITVAHDFYQPQPAFELVSSTPTIAQKTLPDTKRFMDDMHVIMRSLIKGSFSCGLVFDPQRGLKTMFDVSQFDTWLSFYGVAKVAVAIAAAKLLHDNLPSVRRLKKQLAVTFSYKTANDVDGFGKLLDDESFTQWCVAQTGPEAEELCKLWGEWLDKVATDDPTYKQLKKHLLSRKPSTRRNRKAIGDAG